YICLGRSPAPTIYLSANPPSSGSRCYGPVRGGWRAREAVRHLNDHFKLRDCSKSQPIHFSNEPELFPIVQAAGCLRSELGTCSGPCIGACSRANYQLQTRSARKFLQGVDISLMKSLEEKMLTASGRMDFEKAASLRDKLKSLNWLNERLAKLRAARAGPPFV